MSAELWTTLLTSILVPVVLRTLVHFFPWLERDPFSRPRQGDDT